MIRCFHLSCTQFAAALPPTSTVKSAWWLRCAFQQTWLREIQYTCGFAAGDIKTAFDPKLLHVPEVHYTELECQRRNAQC